MDFETENQLFLVAFNPVAEHFNKLIVVNPIVTIQKFKMKIEKASMNCIYPNVA